MRKLDTLIREYVDKFNENFPVYSMMCASDEQVAEIIEQCLSSGKPYEPEELEGDALY